MGTRSCTRITTEGTLIATIYRQYDGYIDPDVGHAKELVDFIKGGVRVNGISVGESETVYNGPECFAASLVARLKADPDTGLIKPGSVYLCPAEGWWPQEFNYLIEVPHDPALPVLVGVYDYDEKPLFMGDEDQFAHFVKTYGETSE